MTETSESWRKQLNVNVVAPSLVTQLSVNLMLEKGNLDQYLFSILSKEKVPVYRIVSSGLGTPEDLLNHIILGSITWIL